MEFKYIDNLKEYVNNLFIQGKKAKLFIKKATVMARPAVIGEEVITYIKDKETKQLIEETRQVIKDENVVVVTNPGGEIYAIHKETFEKNYFKGENEGEYIAKATPRKLIQINENISFEAPWGGKMEIQAGGWLNLDNMDKIYGINPEEFYETHMPYTEKENNVDLAD